MIIAALTFDVILAKWMIMLLDIVHPYILQCN